MKRILLVVAMLVWFAAPLFAQDVSTSGSFTADGQQLVLDLNGHGTVSIQITNTWVATVQFSATVNGTDYFTIPNVLRVSTQAVVTSTTANDTFLIASAAFQRVKVHTTAFTSGTVDVAMVGSPPVSFPAAIAGGAASNVTVTNPSLAVTGPLTDTELRATPPLVEAQGDLGTLEQKSFIVGTKALYVVPVNQDGNPIDLVNQMVPPYTEGDAPVDPIKGGVILWEDAADTLRTVSAAKPLPVNANGSTLGANSGVDIGDVTINNAAGGSAVNIQDGGNSITVDANNLDIRDLLFASDKVDISGSTLAANSGVDIGDVTINNAAGAAAVNIQDGGNSITIDGSVSITGTVDNAELPAAAVLADTTANPTTTSVGAFLQGYNPVATSWDRLRTVPLNADNVSGPPIGNLNVAAFGLLYDGATFDRAPGNSADGALVNLGANNDVTVTGNLTTVTTVTTVSAVTAITNALPAGNNNVGDFDVASFPDNEPFNVAQIAGTATAVNNGAVSNGVQRVTLANDSTGVIASITTSVVPGTAATNLGKAEDAGHTTADTGVFMLGVRNDGTATTYGANNDYTPIATDAQGSVFTRPSTRRAVSISGQESVAAPTADVWYIRKQWALPSGAFFTPSHAWATITTALTKTTFVIANNLGNLNVGTNVFTAANSVASPQFYGRLFGCVTTVLSATVDTITPTYTDELGNSQAATGVVFALSSPVGNCYEFPLAAGTPASALDSGVRAVTAAVDTAATTGVVTFYGVTVMADFAGTAANQTEFIEFPPATSPELEPNEQIIVLMRQAAVTAQLKTFGISGALR